MSVIEHASGRMLSGNPASAVFEREWLIYGKMIDNNCKYEKSTRLDPEKVDGFKRNCN